MILLVAILAGWLAGLLVARARKIPWKVPPLCMPLIAILGFLPQLLLLYLPATPTKLSNSLSAGGLILSLVLLLFFCWFNRDLSGIWILAVGLFLNLLVILANGGFMPISPQTASRLVPPATLAALANGSRFGTKDVLLAPEQTHLIWLSDLFLPPKGFPYQVAFSLGDLFIAAGAFWLMLTQGEPLAGFKK